MNSQHPSEFELQRFASGDLEDERFEEVAIHLQDCPRCCELLRQPGVLGKIPFESDVTEAHDDDPTEGPGSVVGPYKLLQKVGEGGMGVVYMAEQEHPVRRMVALKIIKPGMDSRQVIARFEAERQALAMMDHHHIAKVLDAGSTASGRPYFAMELVKGVPITDYCDRNKLSVKQRLEMFVPVCQAIQHAHQKGIIHRDIKPSNVLVTLYDGKPVPKVIDFGIAKATQQKLTERTMFTGIGQILGTFEYMSPEQAEMNQLDIDTRSDVYSLGVMLYELLTGSTPITKRQLQNVGLEEMLRAIRETEPPKPSTRLSDSLDALPSISAVRQTEPGKLSRFVRGDLDWIVMKALEKDRTRRYETATSLALDVERFLKDEEIEASPPSKWYRMRKFARRNKATATLAVSVTAVLFVSAAVSLGFAVWTNRAESLARAREHEATVAARNAAAARVAAQQQRATAEKNADDARREAEKSDVVAALFKDLIKGVGPSVALGRDTVMLMEILKDAEQSLASDLADQPTVRAELRLTIGDVYNELGQFEQAESQYRQALRLYRGFGESQRAGLAETLQRLGGLPNTSAQASTAWLDEALQIQKACHGTAHPKTVSTLRSMVRASRYWSSGSPHLTAYTKGGTEILRQALSILELSQEDHELEIANTINDLLAGLISGLHGEWVSESERAIFREEDCAEIESYVARVLDIATEREGDEARKAEAQAFYLKSRYLLRRDDYDQSLVLAQRAIRALDQVGTRQIDVLPFLFQLARTQYEMARYADCHETLDRIRRETDALFGARSRRAAEIKVKLAWKLGGLGYDAEGIALERESLKVLGPRHGTDLLMYTRRGGGFVQESRFAAEAAEYMRKCWEFNKKARGPDGPGTAADGIMCADAYCVSGQIPQAVEVLNEVCRTDGNWHHASILNLLSGQRTRNALLCEEALKDAEHTESLERMTFAARAVLVDRSADSGSVQRAIALAEQAEEMVFTPNGHSRSESQRRAIEKHVCMTLALARYRQRRFGDSAELARRALSRSTNISSRLLSVTMAAMAQVQDGQTESALRWVDQSGLLSVVPLTPPKQFRFRFREDLMCAYWLQRELRELLPELNVSELSDEARINLGLERFARFVNRHPDKFGAAERLARLYAWFDKDEEHRELCEKLLEAKSNSKKTKERFSVLFALLCYPTKDRDLVKKARTMAEETLQHIKWRSPHQRMLEVSQQQLAMALSEIRLGDYQAAQHWLDRNKVTLWSQLRATVQAVNDARWQREGKQDAALAQAEELIWPSPGRDVVTIEHINSFSYDRGSPNAFSVIWTLLDEAQSLAIEPVTP